MKQLIWDIKDLSESRELMEARPHNIVYVLVVLLFLLLVGAVVWSYFSNIDVYVKAPGVVRPNDQLSVIDNKVTGKISQVNFVDGQMVKKGAVLLVIDHSNVDSMKSQAEGIMTMLSQVNTKSDMEAEIENLQQNTADLSLLEKSIDSNVNLIGDTSSLAYTMFNVYEVNMAQLNITVKQNQTTVDQDQALASAGAISPSDLQTAQFNLQNAKLSAQEYDKNFRQNIDTQIESNSETISQLEATMDGNALSKGQAVNQLQGQIDQYNTQIDDSTITAPISGVVNVVLPVNKGDYLQGGVEVATIVPQQNDVFKVDLYVSNGDIAGVKSGQVVKFHFDALPYEEYGDISGNIDTVPADATTSTQTGATYYLVKAHVGNKPMYGYNGVKGDVMVGMTCQAYIVTKSEKVLYYLLEQINLRA